jgi:hypothetical protein
MPVISFIMNSVEIRAGTSSSLPSFDTLVAPWVDISMENHDGDYRKAQLRGLF